MSRSLKGLRPACRATYLALAIGVLAPAAHATNFAFWAGLPGTNAPVASTWTYLDRNAGVDAPLTTTGYLPYVVPPGCVGPWPCYAVGWNDPTQQNNVPAFYANNTSGAWTSYGTCCTAFVLPPKCLIVHPGNVRQAVVQFTVPPRVGGGSYKRFSLKGKIADQDFNGGNGVNWWVELNTQNPLYGGTLQSTSAGNLSSMSFPSQAYPVTTGDVIRLVVDAIGDENFDTTAVCGNLVLN
jgi:hypothetical protein